MKKLRMLIVMVAVLSIAAIAQAAYITNVSASASNTEGNFGAFNVVNGSGFNELAGTHTEIYTGAPQVDNGYANWRTGNMGSAANVDNVWFQFDLGALYDLTSVDIWNMNRIGPDLTEHGIEQMDILVSADGTTWTTNIANQTLTEAPGLSTYTGETVTLSANRVRYVKFEVDSAFGMGEGSASYQAGLSEVRFTGTLAALAVTNGGFELPVIVAPATQQGMGTDSTLENWTTIDDTAYYINEAGYSVAPAEGNQYMLMRYLGGKLTQTIGTVASDKTDITLSFLHHVKTGQAAHGFTIGLYDTADDSALVEKTFANGSFNTWHSAKITALCVSAGVEVYVKITMPNEQINNHMLFDAFSVATGAAAAIANGGFETNTGALHLSVGETRDGWTALNDVTYFHSAAQYTLAASEGTWYMLMRSFEAIGNPGAMLVQTVGTVVGEGVDLTLSFLHALRADQPADGFTIGLYDASDDSALVEKTFANGSVDTWHGESIATLDVPVGTEVYVKITMPSLNKNNHMLFDALAISTEDIPTGTVIVIR